ncbi:MAG: TldD/PmbA family protein [Candidatus Nezhaarchaeales archaeon]
MASTGGFSGTLELLEWVIERCLKLGFDEAAVKASKELVKKVRIANSRVVLPMSREESSLSIMACKDGRVLVAETLDLRRDQVERFLSNLRNAVLSVKPREDYAPLALGPFKYEYVSGVYDPRVIELDDEVVDIAEAAINAALKEGASSVAGSLTVKAVEEGLATTRGVRGEHKYSSLSLEVRSSIKLDEGVEVYGLGLGLSVKLAGLKPEAVGAEAGRRVRLSKRMVKAVEGRYDVVLDKPALAVLTDLYGGFMASAFHVDSGMSFLKEKLGQRVAAPTITLIDDPKAPERVGSRPFDDEGLPTKVNAIIEGGILKTYLHNRFTAKRHSVTSTANAGWIVPKAWSLYLKPGDARFDELLREVTDGLLVTNATYARFTNYATGDFSAVVRDGVFKVKEGEIVGYVKNLRLSDNLANVFSNVELLSRDAEQVLHWWMEVGTPVTVPSALVKNLRFTLPTA